MPSLKSPGPIPERAAENGPKPSKTVQYRGLAIIPVILVLGLTAREWLPLSIQTSSPLEAGVPLNPSLILSVSAPGVGTTLSEAHLEDSSGKMLKSAENVSIFEIRDLLTFGQHYKLKIKAQRPWLHQTLEKEFLFETPVLPKIKSSLNPQLDEEDRIELRFSEPVGSLNAESPLPLKVETSPDHQSWILKVSGTDAIQGQHFPITIHWTNPEGIRLPSFDLEVDTAPPLTAELAIEGMKNLGLAMPAEISFSEPVRNREKTIEGIKVTRSDGSEIPGKWVWYGKQKVQFRPEPSWPAHTQVRIEIKPGPPRSLQGGTLATPFRASFETGADRRIEVFLDRQRVEIYENGEKIKTMRASTGKSKTPTVTGSFYIYARFPKKTMKSTGLRPGEKGYYEVKDVPYAQYFYEGYAFHGAFWHNAFGQPASHGCINLATQQKNSRQGINEDAGWLYQWASLGVPVIVHGQSAPKGPENPPRDPGPP